VIVASDNSVNQCQCWLILLLAVLCILLFSSSFLREKVRRVVIKAFLTIFA
jgi:hypothetical protein